MSQDQDQLLRQRQWGPGTPSSYWRPHFIGVCYDTNLVAQWGEECNECFGSVTETEYQDVFHSSFNFIVNDDDDLAAAFETFGSPVNYIEEKKHL